VTARLEALESKLADWESVGQAHVGEISLNSQFSGVRKRYPLRGSTGIRCEDFGLTLSKVNWDKDHTLFSQTIELFKNWIDSDSVIARYYFPCSTLTVEKKPSAAASIRRNSLGTPHPPRADI